MSMYSHVIRHSDEVVLGQSDEVHIATHDSNFKLIFDRSVARAQDDASAVGLGVYDAGSPVRMVSELRWISRCRV